MSIATRNRPALPFSLITQWFEEAVESDGFVSLHIPATPETHGCLHAERPPAIPQNAWLMNHSRSAVVDEDDLSQSQTGNDLRQLPNLLLTPHLGRTLPKPAIRRHV